MSNLVPFITFNHKRFWFFIKSNKVSETCRKICVSTKKVNVSFRYTFFIISIEDYRQKSFVKKNKKKRALFEKKVSKILKLFSKKNEKVKKLCRSLLYRQKTEIWFLKWNKGQWDLSQKTCFLLFLRFHNFEKLNGSWMGGQKDITGQEYDNTTIPVVTHFCSCRLMIR